MADLPGNRPNGCSPTPMIATSAVMRLLLLQSLLTGRNAYVTTSSPASFVENGMMVSSTASPIAGWPSPYPVRYVSTITSPGSST